MSENVRALQGQVPELILHTDRVDCQGCSKWQNEARAESLYNLNYGPSIIYVKSFSNNVSNENIKTGVSREMTFQK